jgi:hypothetical protein
LDEILKTGKGVKKSQGIFYNPNEKLVYLMGLEKVVPISSPLVRQEPKAAVVLDRREEIRLSEESYSHPEVAYLFSTKNSAVVLFANSLNSNLFKDYLIRLQKMPSGKIQLSILKAYEVKGLPNGGIQLELLSNGKIDSKLSELIIGESVEISPQEFIKRGLNIKALLNRKAGTMLPHEARDYLWEFASLRAKQHYEEMTRSIPVPEKLR